MINKFQLSSRKRVTAICFVLIASVYALYYFVFTPSVEIISDTKIKTELLSEIFSYLKVEGNLLVTEVRAPRYERIIVGKSDLIENDPDRLARKNIVLHYAESIDEDGWISGIKPLLSKVGIAEDLIQSGKSYGFGRCSNKYGNHTLTLNNANGVFQIRTTFNSPP